MQVAEFLDRALPDAAVWWHVANQRHAKPQYYQKLKRMGVKSGVPDIGIVYRGKYIAIELKRTTGRESAAQQEMRQRITLSGGLAAVCRSVDEVAGVLGCVMQLRASIA